MKPQFILAIDQGTTSSRAVIFDHRLSKIATAQQEFTQHFPRDGWVEHCPLDIWQSTLSTCKAALSQAQLTGKDIAAIGITNQRETTVLWHRNTGKPLHNAIVWQDRRTHDQCKALKAQGHEAKVQSKTGLVLDPYFSATKLQWLLDTIPNARALAEKGELAFGTIDSWLLWNLTAGQVHKTDATNASRTLLFNIHNQTWDKELLELFNIPSSLLPDVANSADNFGHTDAALFGAKIPLRAMIGDQQAALVGQQCFAVGDAKCTYGTGAFLMINTGAQAVQSQHRLLTTIAYRLNDNTTYAIEGSIFIAGAVIQWLRDGLAFFSQAQESQDLARALDTLSPISFVPAFTGLGAPYWNPDARGAMFGLTRDTGIKEITAAALQSVALQTFDLIQAIENDGITLHRLQVDGGMTQNTWLMQLIADIIDKDVHVPQQGELTVFGAAWLASLPDTRDPKSSDEASQVVKGYAMVYHPEMKPSPRDRLLKDWKKAIQATQVFSQAN
ncbi:glycerol kinase GlpK [Simiduia curdlanivorans]|uniref:Glycerol kinase GlpK n=1 Tax=Simiduia curdlanivorans TaxID=1492769 RepID=A0ABV8V6K3_9GAMM|nr:glycerol kinase GlpK [Simiduia curdlanivorans]MDN3640537.1 glycerol kinase GlpK [Simiduia curdlanivorans]